MKKLKLHIKVKSSSRNIKFCIAILIFKLFILNSLCYAASGAKSIEMGNAMYKKGKFDEALKYYNRAKMDIPNSAVVDFDIGAALYKKGEYKKAIESFTNALLSAGPVLESKINYNIANAKYRIGRRSINTNLQKAIELYRQALSYYKRSIDLNPNDVNAKYNHEFVERELKILMNKLKHQKASSKNNSKNKKSGQSKNNNSLRNKTSLSNRRKQQKKKNTSLAKKKQKEGAKKKKMNISRNNQIEASGQKKYGSNKEMSEKEARMILDRYSEEELSHSSINRANPLRYPEVDKYW